MTIEGLKNQLIALEETYNRVEQKALDLEKAGKDADAEINHLNYLQQQMSIIGSRLQKMQAE